MLPPPSVVSQRDVLVMARSCDLAQRCLLSATLGSQPMRAAAGGGTEMFTDR